MHTNCAHQHSCLNSAELFTSIIIYGTNFQPCMCFKCHVFRLFRDTERLTFVFLVWLMVTTEIPAYWRCIHCSEAAGLASYLYIIIRVPTLLLTKIQDFSRTPMRNFPGPFWSTWMLKYKKTLPSPTDPCPPSPSFPLEVGPFKSS